jgi:hypothetical protein
MMGGPQRLYAFMRNCSAAYGINSSVQDNVIGTRESLKAEPDYQRRSKPRFKKLSSTVLFLNPSKDEKEPFPRLLRELIPGFFKESLENSMANSFGRASRIGWKTPQISRTG